MMNCEDYFILISGLIDNELSNIERRMVRQHLNECDKCREEWLMLSRVQDELTSIAQPEVSVDILESVNQEIEKKEFDDKRSKFTVYSSSSEKKVRLFSEFVRTGRKEIGG